MVLKKTPRSLMFTLGHRGGRHNININIRYPELQQYGGGPSRSSEEEEPRIPREDPRLWPTELYWSTANHLVVFAAITALATLVILMTQNLSESPFDSRPATKASIAISLCIYGVAAARTRDIVLKVQQQCPRGHLRYYFWRIVNVLVLISGVVCLFSIASLFISDGLGWIIYVICAGIFCVLLAVWDIVCIFRENMNSAPVAGEPLDP